MLLTLENRADRSPERGGTLTQIRPRLAWFEIKPQNSDERIAIRVGDVDGYAAPAWSVNVPFWPTRENATEPAKPLIDVWWTRDFPETFATPVRRASNADLASAFKGKVQVGTGATNTVEIEDVRVKERTLEAEPGKTRKVSCLAGPPELSARQARTRSFSTASRHRATSTTITPRPASTPPSSGR